MGQPSFRFTVPQRRRERGMANNSSRKAKKPTDLTAEIMSVIKTLDHEDLDEIFHFSKRVEAGREAKDLLEAVRGMRLPDAIEHLRNNSPSAEVIMFLIILSTSSAARDSVKAEAEFRSEVSSNAADALHDKIGGSREKSGLMKKAWASGKFSSRDDCADKAGKKNGMPFSTARKALRNTLDPSPWPAKHAKN